MAAPASAQTPIAASLAAGSESAAEPGFRFPFVSSLQDWPPASRADALGPPVASGETITRLPPVDELTAQPASDPAPVASVVPDSGPLSSGISPGWIDDDSDAGSFSFSTAELRRGTRYVFNKTYTGLMQSATDVYWDYRNYLSYRTLGVMVVSLGAAAALANTPADQHITDWYDARIRSHTSDVIARDFKFFGTGQYTIPMFLGTAFVFPLVEDFIPETGPVGQWGNRSIQAVLVGGPTMLFLQEALGSARPTAGEGSHWQFFHDSNGVSGHAFMGSIFFLTASGMSDNFAFKVLMVALSWGAGWSRINDNAHYTSQVLMGWSCGWMAVDAVNRTKRGEDDNFFSVGPTMLSGGTPGIQLAFRW